MPIGIYNHKETKTPIYTPERNKKVGMAVSKRLKGKIGYWNGKKLSKETRQKMSLTHKQLVVEGKSHVWKERDDKMNQTKCCEKCVKRMYVGCSGKLFDVCMNENCPCHSTPKPEEPHPTMDNFNTRQCVNGHLMKGIGFDSECPKCEGAWKTDNKCKCDVMSLWLKCDKCGATKDKWLGELLDEEKSKTLAEVEKRLKKIAMYHHTEYPCYSVTGVLEVLEELK